jgi:hypothetical protein
MRKIKFKIVAVEDGWAFYDWRGFYIGSTLYASGPNMVCVFNTRLFSEIMKDLPKF